MDQEKFNQTLGETLRNHRTLLRLTQTDLGKKTGISRASIANMETGRQSMSAYQAYHIAAALGLSSVDRLISPERDDRAEIFRPPELGNKTVEHLSDFFSRSVG